MKTRFNIFIPAFLTAVFAVGTFVPLIGSAQLAASDSTFCASLEAFAKNTTAQIALQVAAIEKETAAQNKKLSEAQAIKDTEIQKSRAEDDEVIASVFAGLDAKASTTAEKNAVKEFKKAVNDVTDIRKGAVDAALEAYREGLRLALADQEEKIGETLSLFSTTVTAELEKAKIACATGISPAVSRPALKLGLKLAKETLARNQKRVLSTTEVITALVAKRRSAITRSDQDFKGALRAARNDLAEAFPEALRE